MRFFLTAPVRVRWVFSGGGAIFFLGGGGKKASFKWLVLQLMGLMGGGLSLLGDSSDLLALRFKVALLLAGLSRV
jgi:hypothetical protein